MIKYSKDKKTFKNPAMPLVILCWLVYAVSYLGKLDYSANITRIIDFYGVSKSQAGVVPTFFFFAYGAGQFFNGVFCKKYNIKWIVFFALIVSGAINLFITLSQDFGIIKWLWLVNGFVLSMLWPTLIRLLSESLPQKDIGTSSVIMGTTVATGTIVIYGLSSLYTLFDNFKPAFYTASAVVAVVAFVWMFTYEKVVSLAKEEKTTIVASKKEEPIADTRTLDEKKLFTTTIWVLCFCAVGVNLTKDGLTTWVPSILKEEFFMSDSLSILLTLLLPVLAIVGNAYAIYVHKKIPDYVNHCALFFAVMAVITGVIIGSLALKAVLFMLAGLVIVNFLASSLNSLLTSIFPMFMRQKIDSGKYAGILNGFCYLGSTASSYGLGVIADNFGWTAVFWTLIGFCVLVCGVWCGYFCFKKSLEGRAL